MKGKCLTVAVLAMAAVAVADDDGSKVLHATGPAKVKTDVSALPVACDAKVTVAGEAESLLPRGRTFTLVWHDEFNGSTLDLTKWNYRTNFWGIRFKAFAGPEDNAVVLKDGRAHLRIVRRADGEFCSPQLQTGELMWDFPPMKQPKGFWWLPKREPAKFVHRYGYYECRCRLQRKPGWWSAFWMQTETQGCTLDAARSGIEHDIMESFYPGEVSRHMFHYDGYGDNYRNFSIPREANAKGAKDKGDLRISTDEFHTFGLLWEPDGYSVYIDGRQHGEKSDPKRGEAVSACPQFILISTECQWYRQNRMTGRAVVELEDAWKANDDFVVDYVRVYDIEGVQ